jgi:beta-glucosidase
MQTDPEEAIQRLLALLDLQGKVRLVTGASFRTTQADQTIGLRSMVLSDGAVGVRGERWDERDPSVALPSPTALAATWDEPLVKRLGGLLAPRRAARASTSCSPRRSTCTAHRSEGDISSACPPRIGCRS